MTVIVGPWPNSTMPKDNRGYPYNLSIDDLLLSVRVYNCLLCKNVRTVGELVKKKRSDLLRTRNFGRKSLHQIELLLDGLGVSFEKER